MSPLEFLLIEELFILFLVGIFFLGMGGTRYQLTTGSFGGLEEGGSLGGIEKKPNERREGGENEGAIGRGAV